MKVKLLASNSGMTLIEVMVSVAISAIVIVASLSIGQMSLQTQAQNNISFQADIIRRNMVALISSNQAWAQTVSHGDSNIACLTVGSGASCNHTSTFQISKVYDSSGNPIYDVSAGHGFNNDGSPCTGASCPLSYVVQWTAMCTGGGPNCVQPPIKVEVKPTYTPPAASGSQKLIFNPANYGAVIYRNIN